MKDLKITKLSGLYEDASASRKNAQHQSSRVDVWDLSQKKNRTFQDKNINMSTFFQSCKITKRNNSKHEANGCTQLFTQLSQTNSFPTSKFSIIEHAKAPYRRQGRVLNPKKQKDPYFPGHTPLLTQLRQSLSNIDRQIRVAKLMKRYDLLFQIKSVQRISAHELLVIPKLNSITSTTTKYVLHVTNTKTLKNEELNYYRKVALLSQSMTKLSNNTYWCLSWQFIK